MAALALKVLLLVLSALPWLAVPLAGWFARKGRWSFAIILALHLCLGAWVLIFGLEFVAAHGKLTAEASGAIATALNRAVIAFVLSLAATVIAMFWRRKQADDQDDG